MSLKTLERTKQIRQKTSTGYQSYPIGTDAALVDMFSSLDLQEQLKIGGDHYVEISEDGQNIEIREWYFSELRGNRTIEEMKQYVTYTVLTVIQNYILQKIQTETDSEEFISDEQDNFIVNEIFITGGDKIEITLYKGEFDKVLHQKVIIINEQSALFTTIDEGVDKQEVNG